MTASAKITKSSASNLAFAFCVLPADKRRDMYALYAFCREVDDVADNENVPVEERKVILDRWRDDLKKIYNGKEPELDVTGELKEVIKKYNLQFSLFDELLKGVGMDLEVRRFNNFDELYLYCYRVASVVGLLSIEIFGYKNEQTKEFAVELGKALQLTNILRDIKNDAMRGRIYIPVEELKRFNVSENDIMNGVYSDRFVNLARAIAARAKSHFQKARQLLPRNDKNSMVAAELMAEIYWNLLKKIEKCNYAVFGEKRMRLGKIKKIILALEAVYWARVKSKIFPGSQYNPAYGLES